MKNILFFFLTTIPKRKLRLKHSLTSFASNFQNQRFRIVLMVDITSEQAYLIYIIIYSDQTKRKVNWLHAEKPQLRFHITKIGNPIFHFMKWASFDGLMSKYFRLWHSCQKQGDDRWFKCLTVMWCFVLQKFYLKRPLQNLWLHSVFWLQHQPKQTNSFCIFYLRVNIWPVTSTFMILQNVKTQNPCTSVYFHVKLRILIESFSKWI